MISKSFYFVFLIGVFSLVLGTEQHVTGSKNSTSEATSYSDSNNSTPPPTSAAVETNLETTESTPELSSTGTPGTTVQDIPDESSSSGPDITEVKQYSNNPTYSKGNLITDEDLEKLSEALFINDTNNANKYITLNLQKQITNSNAADQAPEPLLTVDPEALKIPTVAEVLRLYDNYDPKTQNLKEIHFVRALLNSTNLISGAMRLLADKGFVRKEIFEHYEYYANKDTLLTIWFQRYPREVGNIGSSGYDHVFLAHNWIYFNANEVANRTNYLGYIKKIDLGNKASIIRLGAMHNRLETLEMSMFVGTSPELEMMLYTVCFYARPNRSCPVSLGGTKFNITTQKISYRGEDLMGFAYPEI